MPEVTTTPVEADSIGIENSYNIDTIGIEFEYPVWNPDTEGAPSSSNQSHPLRNAVGTGNEWNLDDYIPSRVPTGMMTADHVGAEITSDRLDLHSDEPELWHAGTIARATDMGYPFSRSGYGETIFGMHLHLSTIPSSTAEALFEMCKQPWMRVFVCSSLAEDSLDPWRHGGVSSSDIRPDSDRQFVERQRVVNDRSFGSSTGHYEWRLPEPVGVDHFAVLMHFLRTLEVEGAAEAEDYARGLVESRDDRLTAVRQYRDIESRDGFTRNAAENDNQTDPFAAEYFRDLMEE